jgi:hypothetical protein
MTLTDSDTDVTRRSEDTRPILLPQSGDGQRRRRRYERQRVVRQRWMAAGAVVVAAVAAVLLLRGTHTGTKPTVAPAPVPSQIADSTPLAPPSVLVQQVNSGRTTSLAAFLPSADGAGGTVLVFPANTTLTAVEANLPRHKAETILTLEDADLARLLAPAGPLAVTVNGAPTSVAPDQIASFFTASAPGDKLARQRAFWDAWLGRVRDNPSAAPAQPGLAAAVAIMIKGTWTVAVPPGTAGGQA